MRPISLCVFLGSISAVLAGGNDFGVPPRPSNQDYPVHQNVKHATLAAAVVPPGQIAKTFSPEIAKHYLVVEVAIYPTDGDSIDVEPFDFALRVGDRISHTEIPSTDAAWRGNPVPTGNRSPQVTTENGVVFSRTTDPYGRTIHTAGTYSDVTVSNSSPAPPPPPNSSSDANLIDQRLRDKALGGGLTRAAVAGYLYFPQYVRKRKSDTVELHYSNDDGTIGMPFPK